MPTLFTENLKSWWQSRRSFTQGLAAADQLSDADLLAEFVSRARPEYMEALIERHGDALFHFLVTLADAILAEDVSQQTWLKVIEKPSAFQRKLAKFRTWLFTVGRNGVVDELRRLSRWDWQSIDDDANEAEVVLVDEDEPLFVTEREGLQEAFDQALTDLPFVQKEAIMLQLEGFNLDGIAQITGEPFETIKSRLRFARKSLKQALEVTS